MRTLIVLNGPPGSGKTTLARPLADRLGVPLISKDSIKEALSDAVGGGLPTSSLGGIALDALRRIAGLHTGTVMIESFWAAGRDEEFFQRGYDALGSPPGVEVWCCVPLELAVHRFRSRDRHPAHADLDRVDEMRELAATAGPISGLPVIEVDTRNAVDVDGLAARVTAALEAGGGPSAPAIGG